MTDFGTSPTSSDASTSSVEIGDFVFCRHGSERCAECNCDFVEDNDFVAGFDSGAARESMTVEYVMNAKDGGVLCKKHRAKECKSCFAFKKTIAKLEKDAAKAAKSKKGPTSNLLV
ncbi:uncharacterized protein L969DRAFT_83937 [Mixia osmundae IAM 14324]|nr:uncharacterized protein L969DRAFT_83937 [Mixia osmundae IAM 14324]KEI42075.1 hypothetical protein L969DRAFT_83937 [Mixia osmundae IAM 14324]